MLVTGSVPNRMRLPLAPAGDRAGGSISAGMISTVQAPLPIRAQIVPKIWPAVWDPSPESLTISTMLWLNSRTSRPEELAPGAALFSASAAFGEAFVPGPFFFGSLAGRLISYLD